VPYSCREILGETTDKGLQKAIKKALHRLKVQGVTFAEVQPKRHTVVVGAVAHRLEKCLASFIDGAGERMLLLIRTNLWADTTSPIWSSIMGQAFGTP